MAEYNPIELMICVTARMIEDGASVSVGTGIPCAAVALAQKIHAPNIMMVFEVGGIAPLLPSMPISVGDTNTIYKAIQTVSMPKVMEMIQRGLIDYALLGGAQIDMYGNINSTVIGDHNKPTVRFSGSGGANDFASMAWRTIMVVPHSPRRFVSKVDFITSPGYLSGPGAREKAGLPRGTGPYKIITNLAVMGFDEETKRMTLESIHPGITLEDVQKNTGFELLIKQKPAVTEPPTEEELRVLRQEVDPFKAVIARKAE